MVNQPCADLLPRCCQLLQLSKGWQHVQQISAVPLYFQLCVKTYRVVCMAVSSFTACMHALVLFVFVFLFIFSKAHNPIEVAIGFNES